MNNETQDIRHEAYQRKYNNYEHHIAYLETLGREWRMKHRMGEPIEVEYHILRKLLHEAILRSRSLQKSLQNRLIDNINEKTKNK